MNFTIFDLETTGLSPQNDEIVEIGAIRIDGKFNITAEFSEILSVKELKLTNIHGITQDIVDRDGINPALAISNFIGFVGDSPLIGHNIIKFDLEFIKCKCLEYGLKFKNKKLDTLILSRAFLDYEKYSLDFLKEKLKLSVKGDSHRALPDCYICLGLLKHIHIKLKSKKLDLWRMVK